jgi:hypothetical protein
VCDTINCEMISLLWLQHGIALKHSWSMEGDAFLTMLSFLDFMEFDAVGNCGLIIINDAFFLKLLFNRFLRF